MVNRPLAKIATRAVLALGLLASACSHDKDKNQDTKPSQPAPDGTVPSVMPAPDGTVPSMLPSAQLFLFLTGTQWEQCSLTYSSTVGEETKVTIYTKLTLDFVSPFTAKFVTQSFSSDKDCTKNLTLDEVKKLSDGEVTELDPIAESDATLTVGDETDKTGVFNIDLVRKDKPKDSSYLVAAIAGDTMEIADRCFNDDYIAEGLCSKVDGDSPDNRATTFGMFGNDRNIFKKISP